VARAGLRADPVVVPPTGLRPYLGFARLSSAVLAAIARAVDQDDEFRARVAASTGADAVGRGGWLWLTRPPGWGEELAAIEAEGAARAASRAAERQAARDERSATRRLAATRAALTRAESLAEERRVELERLRRELDDTRADETHVEARLAELEATVAGLTEARAVTVRNLKDAEARLVHRATEVNALRTRVRELEAQAQAQAQGDEAQGDEVRTPAGDAATAVTPEVDREALARELARAARGAAALADGLAGLAAALEQSQPESAPAGGSPAAGEAAGEGAVPPDRRIPVRLPGGVLDDSVEAAEHLLRTPGAVLVVDGYNVTMSGWPELGAAEQRRRAVAALADLAARTSIRVELVFDGADVGDGTLAVPTPARQLVRVRFSPPGVEADDVVLDLVAQLPASRPVIVASSDNRVRQGARRGGANLLYSRQLLDTLGVGAG
jgi:predicted RNA-binding protein with PIN domain